MKKWTELRECLTALAKRCDMLEGADILSALCGFQIHPYSPFQTGIFEWVSSIARGVIMSMIDLYLADKPDREVSFLYSRFGIYLFLTAQTFFIGTDRGGICRTQACSAFQNDCCPQ